MDRATGRLQDSLRTQSERSLAPGMHFPVDWEPYFNDSMTLLGIDHHSTQHYDHHRQQLTPRVRPAAVTQPGSLANRDPAPPTGAVHTVK